MKSRAYKTVAFPPCGMFVGTGIMNSVPDRLVCSGRAYTTWVSQLFSPGELLDKILEDNQGNLVQYWGFDGGNSPVTFARLFLSGTPYGQVDVISFANDNADADFLSANYKALLFTGWNISSEKQYAELLRYVQNGGTLFVSIPHLSTKNMHKAKMASVQKPRGSWKPCCRPSNTGNLQARNNPMRYSLFYPVLLALAFLLCVAAQAGETLMWQMDFQNFKEGLVPEIGPNMEIRTENGVKILTKTEDGAEFFPQNILPDHATRDWNNIIFRVRFREIEKQYGITLVVKKSGVRGEVNFLWYYVTIRKGHIKVTCHGLSPGTSMDPEDPRLKSSVKYGDIGEGSLVLGEWITAEVQVGEEVIIVSVTAEDGSIRKAEFKTLPGAGGVQILAHKPVDILFATVFDAGKEITPTK